MFSAAQLPARRKGKVFKFDGRLPAGKHGSKPNVSSNPNQQDKLTTTMEYSELDHIQDKEQVVTDIYEKLIAELQKFGPLKIEPKKTSIHLGNRFGFAGVYTRKDYINLEVHLNYKLKSKRIAKVEQASANRFHHTIRLTQKKDIDKELLTWLKEAYDLKK